MIKLLITGASGFLGKPIVQELVSSGEYEIYAVSSGKREVIFPDGVRAVSANLLDRSQVIRLLTEARPTILLHFAWDLTDSGYLNSDTNDIWLRESLFLLDQFIESSGEYFAFAGSCSEYGAFTGFSENSKPVEITKYGKCKNDFHNAAIEICKTKSVDYVNLRIFSTMGSGMPNLAATTKAVAAFAAGEHFECKAPYNVWDYITVDDVAGAVGAILNKRYTGVVNIGSGIPRVVGDVFKTIAQKMNAEHLLSIDYENQKSAIILANTDILNNIIGYGCVNDFDKALDDMIASVLERIDRFN